MVDMNRKMIEKDKLREIIKYHNRWLLGNGGKRANFCKLNLFETNFNNNNLKKADFSNANLTRSSFVEADLTEVNFKNANLTETNLAKARFFGANLKGAIYSVNNLLRAYWQLPDDESYLILELMAHEAESCGIETMDKWIANKIIYPFDSVERDFCFMEDKWLWLGAKLEDKTPRLRGRKLLEALAKACSIEL